ncbi:hypothetical protein GT360_00290 [Vibrio astriarenae]|uniref:Uncharacterized protein n=1 Tax=Vibrio astriarenae TaxID=1481923 RepID=A0A7Z2YCB7_9VIBR|nr:hypothetical protein [Vibrio astriarenae]QIA62088.1 hypothetical protein GT360_00290 [Vibrio astriarenae]
MLFSVSDYFSYQLVEASSHDEAVKLFTGKSNLVLLTDEQLNDDTTVVVAMCCVYQGNIEARLESCSIDIDRVLLMDSFACTRFYTLICGR